MYIYIFYLKESKKEENAQGLSDGSVTADLGTTESLGKVENSFAKSVLA
jgi:hypothetical protein